MSRRHNLWAIARRARLVVELGSKCAWPGCTVTEPEELELDHIHGRDWDLHKKSSSARVSKYVREAGAGLLQLLCKPHNVRKRHGQECDENGDI